MSKDVTAKKRPNFFARFFIEGKILYSLLFTVAIVAIFLLSEMHGVIAQLMTIPNVFLYVMAVLGIFVIFTLLYMFFSVRNSTANTADALSFALFLSSILIAVLLVLTYGFADIKAIPLYKLIICGVLLLISIVYLVLRLIFFARPRRKKKCCKLKAYYRSIAKKYSYLSIIIFGIMFSALGFLLLDVNGDFLPIVNNAIATMPIIKITLIIAGAAMLGYILLMVTAKRTSYVDVILKAAGIGLFTTLAYLVLNIAIGLTAFEAVKGSVILVGGLFLAFLILSLVRISCFDKQLAKESPKTHKCYFIELVLKINPLLIIALCSFGIALGFTIYLSYAEILALPAITLAPLFLLLFPIALALVSGVIRAFTAFLCKSVGLGDLCLIVLEVLAILATVYLALTPMILQTEVLAGIIAVHALLLVIFTARIKTYISANK